MVLGWVGEKGTGAVPLGRRKISSPSFGRIHRPEARFRSLGGEHSGCATTRIRKKDGRPVTAPLHLSPDRDHKRCPKMGATPAPGKAPRQLTLELAFPLWLEVKYYFWHHLKSQKLLPLVSGKNKYIRNNNPPTRLVHSPLR